MYDGFKDAATRNVEKTEIVVGGAQTVGGAVGGVAGGSIAFTGGALCTSGTGCAVGIPIGGFGLWLLDASADQGADGLLRIASPYSHYMGNNVYQSLNTNLNPNTYPGDNNYVTGLATDVAISGATALGGAAASKIVGKISDKVFKIINDKKVVADVPNITSSKPTLHPGQQEKHIPGTNNYTNVLNTSGRQRSIMYGTTDDAQKLLDEFAGTGTKNRKNVENVDFGKPIGKFYNEKTNKFYETNRGNIHYNSKGQAHIVPANPNIIDKKSTKETT